MTLTYFWCVCALICLPFSLILGRGADVTAALMEGAASAITVAIAIAGPLSLWNGLGNLMERLGLTSVLSRLLAPILFRLFPSARKDPELAGAISANVCANLLGLGNAATPMGIRAVKLMQRSADTTATDEMCRLVVLNTASIQLLPTTVAAVRAGAGCQSPFDILPCVWISSMLSVTTGLAAAYLLQRSRLYA